MNDDELKNLWQRQPLREPHVSSAELISAMQNKMTGFRLILERRDTRELLACAVVAIIFVFFYFSVDASWPISRLGDLIVIGSSIFIAWKLRRAHGNNLPAPSGATVIESLRAELNAVRAQSRLLRSIAWWYLLPLAIGIFVCTWGKGGSLIYKTIYTICVIALYAFIYRLNQTARSKQLLPLEAQLVSLLHAAETGEPVDETHRTNLRPLVLSMAAANQAKPIEFKVAYWQIAIYGVPAIVGIWFCWMLGATAGNVNWTSKEQPREAFAQSISAAETNRYSVVARNVVALLNMADYLAVEKLYNPEMSKTFPPRETSSFYTRLTAKFGAIEKIDGPTGNGYRGWIAFRLHCQRGDLKMSLALDADDKIAGIYFLPEHRALAKIEGRSLRVFSWQCMGWFAVTVVGGLLYSWLLQKWTERSVGISVLGVHLYKGVNLVLWDEIKEVRILRILNIRSLWLIRDSGEKMIMPWTSLERHSDLKAAVEQCAPTEHPIRKRLCLLKRI